MSRLYIWDSNALRAWTDERNPHHETIRQAFGELSGQYVGLSVIAVGEMEYGLALKHTVPQNTVEAIREAARTLPPVGINAFDAEEYGRLRAALFAKYGPTPLKKKTSVSQLVDPATDKALGIQENDVWAAAQAIARDAVLVTGDKLARILAVADGLKIMRLNGQLLP